MTDSPGVFARLLAGLAIVSRKGEPPALFATGRDGFAALLSGGVHNGQEVCSDLFGVGMDEQDIAFVDNDNISLPVYAFRRIVVVRQSLLAVAIFRTDGVLHEWLGEFQGIVFGGNWDASRNEGERQPIGGNQGNLLHVGS